MMPTKPTGEQVLADPCQWMDAAGEFIDAAEWHRAPGTDAELTYVDM